MSDGDLAPLVTKLEDSQRRLQELKKMMEAQDQRYKSRYMEKDAVASALWETYIGTNTRPYTPTPGGAGSGGGLPSHSHGYSTNAYGQANDGWYQSNATSIKLYPVDSLKDLKDLIAAEVAKATDEIVQTCKDLQDQIDEIWEAFNDQS